MKLYVNVKQTGSRRNYISREEIILNLVPSTLRELIEAIVTKNVNDFNVKKKQQTLVSYLTNEEIDDRLEAGKVSFGEINNSGYASLNKALESAVLAYEDGIYRVFIGEKEAGTLDEPLQLEEGEVLTFIRLTMLAGRLW